MKFLFFFALFGGLFASLPLRISGRDLTGNNLNEVILGQKKGLVVLFLSAKCPCSNSHLPEIVKLKQDFPQFNFVGIHSNSDEVEKDALQYFGQKHLTFPVLQDKNSKYADQFLAFKTPHAFIINSGGEILYQGGVSNSHDLKNSDRFYLREALEDLSQGKKVRLSEGRTLGCFISRKR